GGAAVAPDRLLRRPHARRVARAAAERDGDQRRQRRRRRAGEPDRARQLLARPLHVRARAQGRAAGRGPDHHRPRGRRVNGPGASPRRIGSAAVTALADLDRRLVWHPYGPMPAAYDALPVASAEGVRIRLEDGRELIDGMASWWCAIHGYRHPVLDAAVRDQLERMAHVMFGGLTHEGAVRLAERLARWTGMDHVFFADSGSVSVEVAIKLALQYWHGDRTRLMTVRGGYHGDTFGAMAVCDPVTGMHSLFRGVLPE